MFYTIDAAGDEDGNMIGFSFDDIVIKKIEFDEGKKLSHDKDAKPRQKAPVKIIKLNIKEGREDAPLPSFMSQPKPIMSRQLLETVRAAGVNNIDAYKASLYYADGRLASDDYFVINVIGVISAADLEKSDFTESEGSKSFDSLTIDKNKVADFLMFRLAENIVEIIINEEVKKAIEDANIPFISVYKTEDIAIF